MGRAGARLQERQSHQHDLLNSVEGGSKIMSAIFSAFKKQFQEVLLYKTPISVLVLVVPVLSYYWQRRKSFSLGLHTLRAFWCLAIVCFYVQQDFQNSSIPSIGGLPWGDDWRVLVLPERRYHLNSGLSRLQTSSLLLALAARYHLHILPWYTIVQISS